MEMELDLRLPRLFVFGGVYEDVDGDRMMPKEVRLVGVVINCFPWVEDNVINNASGAVGNAELSGVILFDHHEHADEQRKKSGEISSCWPIMEEEKLSSDGRRDACFALVVCNVDQKLHPKGQGMLFRFSFVDVESEVVTLHDNHWIFF